MIESKLRTASKLATIAALAFASTVVTACGAAPSENTESDEGAMKCRPNDLNCVGNGGGTNACDPNAQCCWGGIVYMNDPCGSQLYAAGCRGVAGGARTRPVENDWNGHWWFEVYCPTSAWHASQTGACAGEAYWNFPGNVCTSNSPPAGQVDVMYDPNCPSGCKLLP